MVLLLGAGLVMKGFVSLMGREPGFETTNLYTAELTVAPANYPKGDAETRFLDPALLAIRQIPGVREAAFITLPPYVNWGWNFNIRYEGQSGDDQTHLPMVERRVVTPEFFKVTGQRLLSGRLLREGDDARPGSMPVVVVNQALAKRDFKGADPVGKRFHTGDTTYATIVGMVTDIRNFGPVEDPRPEVYWNITQGSQGSSTFPIMIRTSAGVGSVGRAVEVAVHGIDPVAATGSLTPMADVMSNTVGRPRFFLMLLGVFAAVALALAVAGLYGVLSYAVAQRNREIGIRTALGSSATESIALIARGGMRLVALGLALGLVAGAAVTRLLTGLLYGVSPLDISTWAIVVVALSMTGFLATLIPARRATRVDPMLALRSE